MTDTEETAMNQRQSTHVSARYGVGCPFCGAKPHEACRSVKTRRVTDTHRDRIDAYWRERS